MAHPIVTDFVAVKKLIAWAERAAKHGLDFECLQPSIDDPEQMERIVRYIQLGVPELPVGDGPVYDVRQVNTLLNLGYSEAQLATASAPPKALTGFVTFYDPGFSIRRLREHVRSTAITVKDGRLFCPQTWYDSETFACYYEPPFHRQLRMEPVADSFGKSFADQQKLLRAGEGVPSARRVLMGMAIHYLATGECLFPRCFVRCKEISQYGLRVIVGGFDADGCRVSDYSDDVCGDGLGLASVRKI